MHSTTTRRSASASSSPPCAVGAGGAGGRENRWRARVKTHWRENRWRARVKTRWRENRGVMSSVVGGRVSPGGCRWAGFAGFRRAAGDRFAPKTLQGFKALVAKNRRAIAARQARTRLCSLNGVWRYTARDNDTIKLSEPVREIGAPTLKVGTGLDREVAKRTAFEGVFPYIFQCIREMHTV